MTIKKIHLGLLCGICIVLLSNGQEICKEIELGGAIHHPSANGMYYYAPAIHCNGRPVWVDAASRHYLYYLLDGYDGWVVSAESCYKWGNFKIKTRTDEPTPYHVQGLDWSEYFPEKALWEKSETFRVTCASGRNTTPKIEIPSVSRPVKVATSTPRESNLIGICKLGLIQCEEGLDCVDFEDGNFKCVCRSGRKGDGSCGDSSAGAGSGLMPFYAFSLSLAVAIVALLFAFVLVRCCRSARSAPKNPLKLPVSGTTSSVKYKPLDEEITAHPA